jgi:hypothetical protein
MFIFPVFIQPPRAFTELQNFIEGCRSAQRFQQAARFCVVGLPRNAPWAMLDFHVAERGHSKRGFADPLV